MVVHRGRGSGPRMSAGAGRIGVMTGTAQQPRPSRDATLLDAVRAERDARDAAEVRMLRRVVDFCAAHEVAEADAATVVERGHDTGLALAGPGAPWVSEFAVLELATALGMTPGAGRRYLGQVLETRYRLPLVWARVQAGELAWWRAARIAEHTQPLPAAGAAHLDAHLAPVAHKIGQVLTERLCQEALATYDPAQAEENRQGAAEARRVEVHASGAGTHGTVDITAAADLADALDLDAALARAAADLKTQGCEESLEVRRSLALGLIARHYLGCQHTPQHTPRRLVINVHPHDQQVGRCQTTRTPITVAQVQAWCTHPETQVTIQPVRDLNQHIRVDQYEVPDRLDEQVTERDGSCVHPWCTRPASSCDDDHCIPYRDGGPTCSHNIAPLCRRHHRTKTHDQWHYRFLRPGHYLWTSPSGHTYYRDGTGTTDLGRLTPSRAPSRRGRCA